MQQWFWAQPLLLICHQCFRLYSIYGMYHSVGDSITVQYMWGFVFYVSLVLKMARLFSTKLPNVSQPRNGILPATWTWEIASGRLRDCGNRALQIATTKAHKPTFLQQISYLGPPIPDYSRLACHMSNYIATRACRVFCDVMHVCISSHVEEPRSQNWHFLIVSFDTQQDDCYCCA